jgi:DDE superfamily endonuclease
MINETCHVCFLSHTCEGKASDKSMQSWQAIPCHPKVACIRIRASRDFTCRASQFSNRRKHPLGGELIPPEKATNRRISSIRIRIEHAIGGVKRYRIMKDRIRLLKDGIRDTIMETCCGLHNFRLLYRPWNYAN